MDDVRDDVAAGLLDRLVGDERREVVASTPRGSGRRCPCAAPADTAEAGSVFATIACVPPLAFDAAWQLTQTGASSLPTRTSRPWIESW